MLKASSFQQLENKTNKTLQRVEFDVTSYVPVSSISAKISTLEETPIVEEEVELHMYLRLLPFLCSEIELVLVLNLYTPALDKNLGL